MPFSNEFTEPLQCQEIGDRFLPTASAHQELFQGDGNVDYSDPEIATGKWTFEPKHARDPETGDDRTLWVRIA
jgi:hypothetical protein